MENYDTNYWKQSCPKVDCRKKTCKCGLKYVLIPSSLTSEMAPKKGLYCNVIAEYEETGEVYIYSAEGIPVKVKEGNAS